MATTAAVTRVIEIDVRQSANAQAQVAAMSKNLSSIDDTAKKTQASVKTLTSEFQQMASGMVKAMAFAAITTGVVTAVAAIRDMADQTQVLRSRLEQVLGTSELAGKAFNEIVGISVRQGQSMQAVGVLYEKIARQQDQLGLTTAGITKLTEGFAASLRLSGAGAQQSEAAILQFSQALASGKLQGDEFRSMMENNSVFMYKLAEASGKTAGELKKMATEGEINLQFLRENLFKLGKDGTSALDALINSAGKLPMTFKQAMEGVYTQLNNLVDALFNTANKSESIFTRMIRAIGDTMGQAAMEVRMFQGRKAAQAAGEAGKSVASASSSPTDFEAFVRNNTENIAKDLDTIKEKEKELDRVRTAASDHARFHQKANLERLNTEINGLKARVQYTRDYNAELVKQRSQQLTPDVNQSLLRSDWKPPADPPGKKKRSGGGGGTKSEPKEEIDSIYKFYDEITKKDVELRDRMEGMGENMIKFMSALATSRLDKSQDEFGNYVDKTIQLAAKAAKEIDEKLGSSKRLEERNKEVERLNKESMSKLEAGFKKWEKIDDKTRTSEEVYNEARVELEELIRLADELGNTTISAKLTSELNHLQVGFEKTGKAAKTVGEEIRDAMIDSTKEMADAILDFTTGTEASFGKMLARILRQIASAQLQKALNPLMSAAGTGLTSLLSGLFGGATVGNVPAMQGGVSVEAAYGAGSGWGSWTQANGGLWRNGVQFFAKGGVVGGPTAFGMAGGRMGVMGEAGEEAIMPLQRDASGKLGVGAAPVSIEINNYSGAQISQTESVDTNGNRRIAIMVEKAVEDGLATGRYDKVMRSNFGLSRQGR